MEFEGSFGATAFYVWKGNRHYRVYPRDGRIFFIRRQPPMNTKAATVMAAQFGLLGGLIMAMVNGMRARHPATLVTDGDSTPPEQLLGKNAENFVLQPPQLSGSRIEGPGKLVSFGPHIGRWHFTGPDGNEMVMLFDEMDHMRTAIDGLTRALGKELHVNATWDESAKKYRAAA